MLKDFPARWARVFLIALSATGPIFLLLALGFATHTWMFLRGSQRGVATITELRERIDTNAQNNTSSTVYVPVFSFETPDGIKHINVSSTGSNPAAYTVGQTVPIRYRAENPAKVKIDSFIQLWFMPTVFACIGIVGSSVGLIALNLIRKSKREALRAREYLTNP